ncbi:phosphoethanolamine transferase [Photobacterium profundum]|uniref:Predicted membrane-associated metal-dependent hydrolase n=1 Tax=Photobacterium profundum 3TCK TaxID=314280 RepID=Q1YWQ6_9GAMM|nr:phosphoethanolamine--lipid A transferase [Photobacterium profundum]EAS40722.1 Predicted membrane-associated metal-dependent hydrolase [Photobacterium profundum 3TCK]PSV56885.1 phosphoethanolamine transferase [Photobacterium profundum]
MINLIKSLFKRDVSYAYLIFILALYFTAVINIPVYSELNSILSNIDGVKVGFVISIPIFFLSALNFLFNLFAWPYITKPFFVLLLIVSSAVSYAGYNYGTLFDYNMIANIVETDTSEASSYLSAYSILWTFIMGVVPALLLANVNLSGKQGKVKMVLLKLFSMLASVIVIGLIASMYYQDYASVGRNNSVIKKAIIPTQFIYSAVGFVKDKYFTTPLEYKQIGLDAKQSDKTLLDAVEKPTLLVFVVGETARSQNYELNGYPKPTNQYTRDLDIISFQDVSSCGTATAVSVPCMFSSLTKSNFNRKIADNQDNLLDVLNRADVSLLWKENDGGDKNVADRITKKETDRSQVNSYCDGSTCYDMALLEGLEQDIDSLSGNRMIALHLIGSHGPTYFKRYPEEAKFFMPDCPRSDIENCSVKEIVNTYDNTILYTDYVISQTISKLKKLQENYNTALIYISDHGESLGENGMFLHGMPYSLAPDYQTKVPLMFWMSDGFKQTKQINTSCVKSHASSNQYSQDNIFHSVLGLMDVETNVYEKQLDIFSTCRS